MKHRGNLGAILLLNLSVMRDHSPNRSNNPLLTTGMLKRSIVLIGLTGSGKTTVGRRLSKHLNCAFVDTDEVVSASTGLSVREIFEQQGESAFRDHEIRAMEVIFAVHPGRCRGGVLCWQVEP